MKKNFKLKALVVLLFTLLSSFLSTAEYHHGFILSCTVIYQTFPTEPTPERLLELHDLYERQYCSGNVGNESGIQ